MEVKVQETTTKYEQQINQLQDTIDDLNEYISNLKIIITQQAHSSILSNSNLTNHVVDKQSEPSKDLNTSL